MAETAVPESEVTLPVERGEPKSETEWLDERKRARAGTPEPEKAEPDPSEEIEPEQEPEGDPDQATEPEDEAEDATLEEEQLAEASEDDAEPSEETEEFLSGTVSLEELAEGLEVSPEDLADHVQVTVTANGKDETVSLAELRKGYAREADYTRSKMALAEEKRDFDATSKSAIERHNASVQQLDAVAMMLAQEIDTGLTDEKLAQLKEEDPVRWSVENDNRNRKLQAFNQAVAQRRQLDARKTEETQKTAAEYRTKQQGILKQRMPEMADNKKVQAFETDVGGYLTSTDIGYTQDEVTDFFNGPWDARQIQVLADAAKYRASLKAESKAKKKIKKFPLKSKSKARRTRTQSQDNMRSAKARLRAEGSEESALAMLKERRRQRNASHGGSK